MQSEEQNIQVYSTDSAQVQPANGMMHGGDFEYVRLVTQITELWETARAKAAIAVNTVLLDANWQTGQYIVEFEQGGNAKAKYGDKLLVNLSKDLTRLRGRGFSRSNLVYMRKLYMVFPKSETLSHQLTWSHYFEILKCDDPLEMRFYMNESIKERWTVRELKRQVNSALFQRLALSTDKEGVLALANEGHQIMTPSIGQMNLYLNYFKNEICQPDDNPPVGILFHIAKQTKQSYGQYQKYLQNRSWAVEQPHNGTVGGCGTLQGADSGRRILSGYPVRLTGRHGKRTHDRQGHQGGTFA